MRKFLLLLAAIMVTLTIDAQKMKFSGDNSCIKENVTAKVVIDVSHATWEKKVLKTEDIHPPKTGISVHFSGSLV